MKTYSNGQAAIRPDKTALNKLKRWAAKAADKGFEKAARFMAKHPHASRIIGGGLAVYGGGKLAGACMDLMNAGVLMINGAHPVAMESSLDKLVVFMEGAPVWAVGAAGAAVGGVAVMGGLYAGAKEVIKGLEYAEDNRLLLKARVAIRKQAQKSPKLHRFLVAANHRISKGVTALKKELAGGR